MALLRPLLRAVYKPGGVRASIEKLQSRNVPDPPPRVAGRHDVRVAEVGGTRVVWLDESRAAQGTVVFLHGGSYHSGPLAPQWEWFGALVRETGTAGLMIDYSLAPRHSFPVALEEVLAVVATLDGPWVLAGDSAGGGLALGAVYELRDHDLPQPRALVLSSPWLDVTMSNPAARSNQKLDPMLSLRGLARGAEPYAGAHDPRDPRISPLFGDPGDLPPMLVHVGTRELFLRDCEEWKRRCEHAGTRCELIVVDGAFHDFAMAVTLLPEARTALRRQSQFVREAFATSPASVL